MAKVFRSGAFVQQCFAIHPLCLSFETLRLPDELVLRCTSCDLLHRLTLRTLTLRVSPVPVVGREATGRERGAEARLAECAASHPTAIGVRTVDVVREIAGLRCGECRHLYDLDVASFETHQR